LRGVTTPDRRIVVSATEDSSWLKSLFSLFAIGGVGGRTGVVGLCIRDDPGRSCVPFVRTSPFNAPLDDDRYCARKSGEVTDEMVVSRLRGRGL
jgi:hypothetical protein